MTDEVKKDIEKTEPKAAEAAVKTAPLKGIIGTKIGMARIFVNDTTMVPVTVISTEDVVVSMVKKKETEGYSAVQVSYGDVLARKLSKAELNHFEKKGLKPKRFLREFRVDDAAPFEVGQVVPVTIFKKGELVDVSGMNKGRGFAGVVKRHGFAGGPHSHGHGEYRNSPGSSGAQGPQHVLPGTRKPGHKGHIWQTIQNVEVVEVDTEKNLVLLRGSVPGPNGNFVVIRSTR